MPGGTGVPGAGVVVPGETEVRGASNGTQGGTEVRVLRAEWALRKNIKGLSRGARSGYFGIKKA